MPRLQDTKSRISHGNFALYFVFSFWPIITLIITTFASALPRGISWWKSKTPFEDLLKPRTILFLWGRGKKQKKHSPLMLGLMETGNCQRSCFLILFLHSPSSSSQHPSSQPVTSAQLKPQRLTANALYPIGIPAPSSANSYQSRNKALKILSAIIDKTNDFMKREHVTGTGGF